MSHLKSLNEFVAKNKARLRLILACGDALIITVPVLICIACVTYPARNTLAQWCAIGVGTYGGTLIWGGTLQGTHLISLLNSVQ